MSSAKLKALDKYLIKILIKEWIQEFKSLIEAPVLFTPRKSGELQFCIDYQDLNTITVKNCYLLPLINELLN